jgi:hypothetical protein
MAASFVSFNFAWKNWRISFQDSPFETKGEKPDLKGSVIEA